MTDNTTRSQLFSNSVIVTGSHCSMSTPVGREIGASSRHKEVARKLMDIQFGEETKSLAFKRPALVHSIKDVARVLKFTHSGLRRRIKHKRAVFKDPFLCFTARHLQERHGIPVVLTVRHPCGFAESLTRVGKGFDFNDLMQPELLDALPDLAEEISRFAHESQPIIDQAALLWAVIYGYTARYYLSSTRTLCVRQEDFVLQPKVDTDRMMTALGAERCSRIDTFFAKNMTSSASVDFPQAGGSYIQRDARKTAEKWKSRLKIEDKERVMARVGRIAEQYGYSNDGAM